MTLPAPLGRARVADHCDRWHTSLGRLIKVLAVLCCWINARMGTLDGFPISDQLDYVNAVGGQRCWNRLLLRASWTLSDPLGSVNCQKDLLLLRKIVSACSKVQWSANNQLQSAALPPLLLLLLLWKLAVSLFPATPVQQSKSSGCLYLLSAGPAGSSSCWRGRLLAGKSWLLCQLPSTAPLFLGWGDGHGAPTCSVQIRASVKCLNVVQRHRECVALLGGLAEHYKADAEYWHHCAAGSYPWQNLSAFCVVCVHNIYIFWLIQLEN